MGDVDVMLFSLHNENVSSPSRAIQSIYKQATGREEKAEKRWKGGKGGGQTEKRKFLNSGSTPDRVFPGLRTGQRLRNERARDG